MAQLPLHPLPSYGISPALRVHLVTGSPRTDGPHLVLLASGGHALRVFDLSLDSMEALLNLFHLEASRPGQVEYDFTGNWPETERTIFPEGSISQRKKLTSVNLPVDLF